MSSISISKKWSFLPQGVAFIFFVQLFSTTSFAVLYAALVLYMKQQLNLSSQTANTLTGVYFAYNFGLHLLAGFLGGRFFSYRNLISIGLVFQMIGCFILSHPTMQALYLGLTGMLIGTGTITTCINMTLSQIFQPGDQRRETAFFWNYSGMNIGFLLGFTMTGYYQLSVNYSHLFLSAAAINFIALFCVVVGWKHLADRSTLLTTYGKKGRCIWFALGCLILLLLIPALYFLLRHVSLSDHIVLAFGVIMYLFILYQALRHKNEERFKLLSFFFLLLAALMFFIIYQLAPMGVTLFSQYNVDRHVFGFLVPPGWLPNINSIVIIIGGPLLAVFFSRLRKKGSSITVSHQYAVGLLIAAIGSFMLPLGIKYANALGYVAFSWIFVYYVLQALAELCIGPIGYSMVGLLIPKRLQSIMMGTVLLNSGVAAVLASYFSVFAGGKTDSSNPLITNVSYNHIFITIAWVTLVLSVVYFLLIPILKKWINSTSVVSN